MTHLTPDELVDAADATLAPDRRRHLANCETCRAAADDLGRTLAEARAVDVPDPSPLFWDHFSTRVRDAIRDETSPSREWAPGWFRWPVLVPIGALVLLVTSLALVIPRHLGGSDRRATAPAEGPATLEAFAPADDVPWTFMVDVMAGVDLDAAALAELVIAPGSAEAAVAALDPGEHRELLRLLEAAIARPES